MLLPERKREFHRRLRELGYASYREYLRSEHWADVKRRFRASGLAKKKCCHGCGSTVDLEVHHKTYKRIGAEWLNDLALVCRGCHQSVHDYEEETKAPLGKSTKRVLRTKQREAKQEHRARAGQFAPRQLDERGQCCGRAPVVHRRMRVRYCARCCASFHIDTGAQVVNWAWKRGGQHFSPTWPSKDYWTHVASARPERATVNNCCTGGERA